MIPGKTLKPEDLLQIARRRWRVVFIPFLVSILVAAVVIRRLPDRYRSETLILVVPQRVPESYVRATVTTRIDERLRSINQQLMSRTRLEPIIREFSLYATDARTGLMEDVVERMRRNIQVQIVRGDAFHISYVSEDPRTAMKVTERLASLYINENLRDREVLADGTNEFLDSQLAVAKARLIEHERKLEAYKMRYTGQLPDQVQPNLQVMQNAQFQIQALVESANRDRDRRSMLESALGDALASTPAEVSRTESVTPAQPTAAPSAAALQLAGAIKVLQEMRIRLKPKHPDILRQERQVADLQKKVDEEAASAPPPSAAPLLSARPMPPLDRPDARLGRIDQMRAEIGSLGLQITQKEREEERLRRVVSAYQSRVESAPARQSELTELTRDYDTLHRAYTSLLAKKEDAQVAANLERFQIGEQFKILDPARLPEKPISPDRVRLHLIGAAVGLAFGLLLGALLEYRDTTLKTEADVVSALTLPVLALVPDLITPRQLLVKQRRQAIASWTTAATAAAVAIMLFWVFRT